LHGYFLAVEDDYGFSPVYLGILAGIELQRDIYFPLLLRPSFLGNVASYSRLATGVPLGLDLLVDLVTGSSLLPRIPSPSFRKFRLGVASGRRHR